MRQRIIVIVLTLIASCAFSLEAGANGWGPRVGVTLDPDQIHGGVHADFGEIARNVRFQPNVELGLGDDLTLIAVNFEAMYRFAENWDQWSPYAGGGIGLNWISWDSNVPGADDSDMDVGLNLLGGIEKGISGGDRFFLELKLGLVDSPDMKVTVGWMFF